MPKGEILFIEDSKTQGIITKEFLEKNGYQVTWIMEGAAALQTALEKEFDVILMDRILPDMDGNELCVLLKHHEATQGVPIIMLTAKSATMDKVEGLECGADDYLPKPYEESELNARIYAALRTKRLQDELKLRNQEMKEMLDQVEALSITDPLTGLNNRRRFERILENEFKKSTRYSSPISCLMLDIDHFKAVNDTYGHAAGDAVLKDVAKILKKSIRDVDTACRWGGEEFIVLLPMTAKAFAITPARRILNAVSEHAFAAVRDSRITISIGIADGAGKSLDSPEKLINAADSALYRAKKNGRNRIEIDEAG